MFGYDIIYKKVVLTLDKIDVFKQMIQNAKRIVFFGSAGVSTESGIPDFRSEDGLYRLKYPYSPEEILSHHFFMEHQKKFYRFYKKKFFGWMQSQMLPISNWLSWKKREDYPALLHRILMDFTNWQEVNMSWNCMVLFTGTIA